VVCSGREASAVREQHGPALERLVPGIRFADGAAHDQARVVTPGAAAASGADYLVIGRAVTAAADPAAAMRRVLAELRLSAGAAPA
jgi:orotidine-5'-phosphate decarboxylase